MVGPRSVPPWLSDPEKGNVALRRAQGPRVAKGFLLNSQVAPSRHIPHNAVFFIVRRLFLDRSRAQIR